MGVFWQKLIRDIVDSKMQSFLVIFAITIGIMGAGSITTGYAILNYEIDANYQSTNPADFILTSTYFDTNVTSIIGAHSQISNFELRSNILSRIDIQGTWMPIMITVIDNFDDLSVATFELEKGGLPKTGEMVLERSSTSISEVDLEESLLIKVPGNDEIQLSLSGVVHDPAKAPGWQDGINYGYLSMDTLRLYQFEENFEELHVELDDSFESREQIIEFAVDTQENLESNGYTITNLIVPENDGHPHKDQMNALIYLIQIFGILTQILSGILVYITISFFLSRQTKQIGILKTVGGSRKDLVGLFYSYTLVFAGISMVIGIPVGNFLGKIYATMIASLLNFDITRDKIPVWVFGVDILIGVLIPLLASYFPIRKALKITVTEAIRNEGRSDLKNNPKELSSTISKVGVISTMFVFSIRNVFRRKTRFFLILFILTLGGATFIAAINVGNSWNYTIDTAAQATKYDIKVDFSQPYETNVLMETFSKIPEISNIEGWDQVVAIPKDNDISEGIRFRLHGIPLNTEMIDFPLLSGRWFNSDDTNAIVINHELYYDDHTSYEVGDQMDLTIENQTATWKIVGVIREIGAPRRGFGTPASAYVSKTFLNEIMHNEDQSSSVRIQVNEYIREDIETFKKSLEKKLGDEGYDISVVQTTATRLTILRDHLVVILLFLFIMTLLILIVGALSLSSITSMNVLERSREIGILRTLGGSTRVLLWSITLEGLIIGILSFIFAALISIPLSAMIGNYAAWIFIRSSILLDIQAAGYLWWIVLILLISGFTTYFSSIKAIKRPIHEVITYE